MSSPRTRIDQFFASKKRKPISPSLKDKKFDKDSKSALDRSPSTKGTLVGFLANSNHDNRLGQKLNEGHHTVAKQGPVKRNLTLEVDLASEIIKKPSSSLNNFDSQVLTQQAGVRKDVEQLLQITTSDEAINSRDCSRAKPISGEASDVITEVHGRTSNGEQNSVLKELATDFLFLYCSEVPSCESSPLERKLQGQKRSGSPSLLVDNCKMCKKEKCVSHRDLSCGGEHPSLCLEHTPKISGLENRTAQAGSANSEMLERGKELDNREAHSNFRNCGQVPNALPVMVESCTTPVPLLNASRTHETPKSLQRSSIISPGDAFWNEAIQVVDDLFAPVDKVPFGFSKDICLMEDQHGREGGNSSDPLKNDAGPIHVEQNDNMDLLESHGSRSSRLPAFDVHMDASPLPVKHFDFSFERNLSGGVQCQGTLINVEGVCNTRDGFPDSNSVKRRVSKSSNVLIRCKSLTDKQCHTEVKLVQCLPMCLDMDDNASCVDVGDRGSLLDAEKGTRTTGISEDSVLWETSKTFANKIKNHADAYYDFGEDTTPSSSRLRKDCFQINRWLPSQVCDVYMKRGISKLYSWQVACLQVDGVLEKRNLVYCASTSAGKSFVAEILMLRRVISTGKMALLVLPYVSICAEKAEHLQGLMGPLGKHVRSFYGNQGGATLPKDTSVAVCTIEKANSLVNRLLEEGRLSEVGVIVIDELHMVGDQSRGYLLELLLTKLRYAAGEGNTESSSGDSCSSSGKSDPDSGLQIIGMSATMPNVAAVADWLQAALYQTDFRPVPLEEYFKVGNTIYNKKMEIVRTVPKVADLGGKDPDHIVELCNEVVQEGHSVLLFCSSRKGCESTARHIAKFLKSFATNLRDGECEFSNAFSAIDALRKCPAGLDPILEETLPFGVAYHHAGLTVEEREIVETCYRRGVMRVLTATSTLAAGVNLPARRVIFRQPRIGRDFIDGTRYRQMAGRAGRTGIDTRGESILICKPEEVKRIIAMLNDSCPPLQSCLSEDKNGMTHAILEVVAGGIVQTARDINRYVRCTLLNSTRPFEDVVKSAQDSLRWLCRRKFLEWNEETKLYSTTPLGRAAFGSSLCPEESLVVLDDLSRAREGFVLASDLHLVYLVTPINVDVDPDWELYYERFMELSALDQSVGNRVGVVEPFLMRMAHGAPMCIQDKSREERRGMHGGSLSRNSNVDNCMLSNEQTLRVCKRFYVALILSRLVQEVPIADVCEAFKVSRGMVQALQENAGRFALMVSLFCERLGWHDLEGLVAKFQNRVSFGVRAEIAELTTIPYVKGSRARAFYKAGFRTPLAIAEASIPEIVKALFEYTTWRVEESALRKLQVGVAKKIKNGARKIVLDQAEEAKVAAFSAFKSLGVIVPQLSWPLISPCMVGSLESGNTDLAKCITSKSLGAEPHGAVQLTENSPLMGIETNANVSVDHLAEMIPIISRSISSNVAEFNLVGSQHFNVGKRTLAERPTHFLGPGTNLITGNTVNSVSQGMSNTGMGYAIPREYTDIKREEGNQEGCKSITGTPSITEKGPINVNTVPGGIDAFLELWCSVKEFYFDIHFNRRSEKSSISFEILGMAVCWECSRVYYVNLCKDLVSSNVHKLTRKSGDACCIEAEGTQMSLASNALLGLANDRWNKLVAIMERTDVKKFTWKLKDQIQVLQNPRISLHRFNGLDFEYKDVNGIRPLDDSHLLLPPISVKKGIDMCIVAWMLWPDEESHSSPPSLEKEVEKRLSRDAAAAAKRDGRWRNQMRKAAHNGCCHRVAQTRALGAALWKLIISEELVGALTRIECPLVKVLADMEVWGIGVDMEACIRSRHVLAKKLKELEKEAHSLAGMTFSLYSSADIAFVLFQHLKLPTLGTQNKEKQHPSTNKHSLDLLRDHHPIVPVIKEHRTLAKLLNSTVGSICSQARLISEKYTIHGHWLQTSTSTGRLSMEAPNLQAVEHKVDFTIGQFLKNSSGALESHQINARDFFVPTKDNWLLLGADYSQIELRLMAHFSKDSSLIEFLRKPDGDVFTMMAARWTGKQESCVGPQEREQTKRLVYGILYGMGAKTLGEQLDCSSDEAAEKINIFKSSFPGVSAWLSEAVASCRQKGCIETLNGRKRMLSKIKFGNNKEKAKAQRQAVNSICQGSAADIIKIAMINIHAVIVEGHRTLSFGTECATDFSHLKGRCHILLQVHDELLLEADPSLMREAGLLLKMSMESAVSLEVPLRVKMKIGKTWGSMEPFEVQFQKERRPQ